MKAEKRVVTTLQGRKLSAQVINNRIAEPRLST